VTKERGPDSLEEALGRIMTQVPGGYVTMGARVDRAPGYLRAYGDPDRDEQIPLPMAIELDLLFQEHAGIGAPIHEFYSRELEVAQVRRFASGIELAKTAIGVIKEAGDAGSAIVAASLPGATRSTKLAALKEAVELDNEVGQAIAQLKAELEEEPPP
jgi:hypothetical protein